MTDQRAPSTPRNVFNWKKALGITAVVASGILGVMICGGMQALDRGRDLHLKELEQAVVDRKSNISNYDDVREFLRARVEKRPPNLTADRSDAAKAMAERVDGESGVRYNLNRD